jgi:sec-independent protein translocase protein TatC
VSAAAGAGASGPEEHGLASMTLMEHLAELRSRLIKSVLALFVGAVVMWFIYVPVFKWMFEVLQDNCVPGRDCAIIQTDPLQGLSTRMTFAGYGGIALAMPVLLYQVWKFVTPGLYPREKRLAIPFVFFGVVLFILGAGLALWTLPKALDFLISIGGGTFNQFYTPDKYVSLVVKMMVAFGIGFEFPILLVFLQLAGVLSPSTLARHRRWAIVGIVILVAVLTPSGDPISLAALAVPMYLFYELSILIGWLANRRRRRRDEHPAAAA